MKCAEDCLQAGFAKNPTLASLIVSTCGLNVPLITASNLAKCYQPFDTEGREWRQLKKYVEWFLHEYFLPSKNGGGFFAKKTFEDIQTWPVGPESFGEFGRRRHSSMIGISEGPVNGNASEQIANQFFRQSLIGENTTLKTRQIKAGNVTVYHFDDLSSEDIAGVLNAFEIAGIADSLVDAESRAKDLRNERRVSLTGVTFAENPKLDYEPKIRANVSANIAQGAMFASYLKRHGLGVSLHSLETASGQLDSRTHGTHRLRWKVKFVEGDFYRHLAPAGELPSKFGAPKEEDDVLEVIAISWTDLIDVFRDDYPSKEWLASLLNERLVNRVESYMRYRGVDAVEIW